MEFKVGIKRQQLEEALKDDIICGRLKPGDRLPTYEAMTESYDISRATFHYVLKHLKEDRFVGSQERQGVFVADRLPYFHRIGLVLESHERENVFFTKMAREAFLLNQREDFDFHIWRGNGAATVGATVLADLAKSMERRTLAGLVIPYEPKEPALLELLDRHPDLPYLLFEPYPHHARALVLRLSNESCAEKAVRYFGEAGRRSLAVLSLEDQPLALTFVDVARKEGMAIPEEWVLPTSANNVKSVERLVRLLLSLPADRRPNGIYVTDDNLLTGVQTGLVKAGVRVPEDVMLLSHDNFPDADTTVFPIRKIGFDVRDILRQAAEMIQAARRGRPTGNRDLAGQFDNEVV